MSDRNRLVRKYRVTFEIELYEASASEGFVRACELQRRMLDFLARMRVADLLADTDLPTGGVHGAAHGPTLDGWRCVYTISKA